MSRSLAAISEALIDALGAAGKPAVLIVQYDIERDEHVFRWSCEDRSIGFRRRALEPLSPGELAEAVRTWHSAELAPGSTAKTGAGAALLPQTTSVLWTNFEKS